MHEHLESGSTDKAMHVLRQAFGHPDSDDFKELLTAPDGASEYALKDYDPHALSQISDSDFAKFAQPESLPLNDIIVEMENVIQNTDQSSFELRNSPPPDSRLPGYSEFYDFGPANHPSSDPFAGEHWSSSGIHYPPKTFHPRHFQTMRHKYQRKTNSFSPSSHQGFVSKFGSRFNAYSQKAMERHQARVR